MTAPSGAGNLPLPRWAYVPGGSQKSSADYETLAQITALVPPRFGGYVSARHPALRYGLTLSEHETKCMFRRFRLDLLKNMHYCASNEPSES